LFALAAVLAAATAAWGRVPTPVNHARPVPKPTKLRHGAATPEGAAAKSGGHAARPAAKANGKAAAKPAKPAARAVRRPAQLETTRGPVMKRAALKKTNTARESGARSESRSEHSTAVKTPAEPKTVPAGGELTADDFFRAAGGAPETKVAAPEAKTSAADTDAAAPAQPAAKAEKLEHGESHPVQDDRVVVPPTAKAAPAKIGPTKKAAEAPSELVLLDDPPTTHADLFARPTHEEMADEAIEPLVLPGLYRNGRLVVPAPLKGTHEILVHQNLMADDEGLERIRDNEELARLRASRQLVNLPESASLHVNPELGADRRCARVWTVKFAADMARAFYARFHEPLEVNSAVRTVAYQVRLQRTNGNAAGVGGEVASPHLTGQAIDIGKHGMTVAEIAWMRAYLKPLMDAGKVDVEEEFQQACFHISVYKSYLPAKRGVDVAQVKKPAVAVEVSR